MPMTRKSRNEDPQISKIVINDGNQLDDSGTITYIAQLFDEKFSKFKQEILTEISSRDEKIEALELRVVSLERIVCDLAERLEDGEASNRSSEFIMSGESIATADATENSTVFVRNILKGKLNYELGAQSILLSKRLGVKPTNQGPDKRKILVKVKTDEERDDILRACRTIKPNGLYLNDNLTQGRSKIMYALRQAKRRKPNVLSGCGSQKRRVFAFVKAPDQTHRGQKIFLNTWEKFVIFCQKTLELEADSLVSTATPTTY